MTPEQLRYEAYLRERHERKGGATSERSRRILELYWKQNPRHIQPEPTDIVTEGYEVTP